MILKCKILKLIAYLFSEIYIDEKNRKIVGSDVKSFLNDNSFKVDERNEPRFFANSAFINEEGVTFQREFLQIVKIEKEENVLLGQFKLKKLIIIKQKKQCITITQF